MWYHMWYHNYVISHVISHDPRFQISKQKWKKILSHTLVASLSRLWVRTVLFVGKCEFRFWRFKKASRALATTIVGQKHTVLILTGNLPIVQRSDLTTEPTWRLQIWHIKMRIIAIIKSDCKKEFTTRKTCWITAWLLVNSGSESHNAERTWQL